MSKIQAIEVFFPAAVELTNADQQELNSLISKICDRWVAGNPGRVMWTFGVGQKMLTNPFMTDDEHPMEYDASVFQIECSEREDYKWLCAKCRIPQGDHAHCISSPLAGVCEFEPEARPVAPGRSASTTQCMACGTSWTGDIATCPTCQDAAANPSHTQSPA